MVKQITIDKPTIPNLFSHDDALITTATTAIDFVSDDLEKLAVQLISNNELRVKSGSFCIGGHYGYIPSGSYETCYVSPGNIGFRRKDLIVAKYTRVGTLDYIGIQIYTGVPSKGEPVIPTYSVSDLNADGKIREIPLHVVELNGMDIISVTPVFETLTTKDDVSALFKTSFFTTIVGSTTQYHAKIETCGIVTETLKQTKSYTYIFNVEGVWKAETVFGFVTPIESGYTASDIVVFPSSVSNGITKQNIRKVEVIDADGVKKISIGITPYAFANITTAISSDFSVCIRYKKVKL
jgi:hypothetical protein